MATKLPAAQARLFKNIFVCKACSKKIKSDSNRIINQKVSCPRCGRKSFRPIKRK